METPPRQAFYFTVDLTPRDEAWIRTSGLFSVWPPAETKLIKTPGKLRLDRWDRPEKGGDAIRVSFLLVPRPSSAAYDILVCGDTALHERVAKDRDSFRRQLAGLLRGGNVGHKKKSKSRWRIYSAVPEGLFYGVRGGERHLLRVIPGVPLCYGDESQRIRVLGVPKNAVRIDLGLSGYGQHYAALERNLKEAVLRGRTRRGVPRSDGSQVLPHARQLTWEMLPAGPWRRQVPSAIPDTGRNIGPTPAQLERLTFLDNLHPGTWYAGSILGRQIYFAAVFSGVIVADSSDYGNALYYCVCHDNSWQDVLRLTKAEALRAGAKRIVHSGNWKARLRRVLWIHSRLPSANGTPTVP